MPKHMDLIYINPARREPQSRERGLDQSLGAALPAIPAPKNKSLAHSHKPEIGRSRYR
jgi:hypothetical protein